MTKLVLSDKCTVTISRRTDETPIIIFEDLLISNVKVNSNGVNIQLDVDKDVIEEIISIITPLKPTIYSIRKE